MFGPNANYGTPEGIRNIMNLEPTSSFAQDAIETSRRLLELSKNQYQEFNTVEINMAANDENEAKITIDNTGAFFAQQLVGTFTTINDAGVDDGICRTRIAIEDSGLSRKITNKSMKANLILSPGRIKSITASGDQSQGLYLPLTFNYYFKKDSSIVIKWKNESAQANTITLVFIGMRYIERD